MSTPIHFMVEHQNEIIDAFAANQEKPMKTWARLTEILPEISSTMQFNTFKQYVRVFAVFFFELEKVRQNFSAVKQKLEKTKSHQVELDKVRQNMVKVTHELDKTKNQNYILQEELTKVRQSEKERERVTQRFDKHPKRISGWSVQRSKDGYFRCYRKIEGIVHCVYIGKKFNAEKAQERIMKKEKSLGLLK